MAKTIVAAIDLSILYLQKNKLTLHIGAMSKKL
jgi:hypothetical protein